MLALLLSAALLAASPDAPPAADAAACTAQDAFERGRAGSEARAGCTGADYREARQLGVELARLEGERAELAAQAGGDAAARGRRIRLLEIDIDAIRALLLTRGVSVDAGPSPGHGS